MSTTTTWPGGATDATPTAYSVPASGELNWPSLSDFLNALAASSQSTTAQKWGVRKATSSPVSVSATADCVIVCQLSVAGAVTVNLPAGANKQVFCIIDGTGDAATNTVTINRAGSDTIAGATTATLTTNRETIFLVYNSSDTDWKIAGRCRSTVSLSSGVSGVLPIANGGSNKALTLVNGGLIWSDADSFEVTAAGTSNQLLISNGAAAPTWVDTVTGVKTFSGQLIGKGTATNDDAAAGYIGEVLTQSTVRGSNVTLTVSDTIYNVTASPITLTAGDWLVSGVVVVRGASATCTKATGGLSLTSATLPGNDTIGVPTAGEYIGINWMNTTTLNFDQVITIPAFRLSVSGSTPLYLIARGTFSAGTVTAYGFVQARRAR